MRELGRIFTKPKARKKVEGLGEGGGEGLRILFPFTITSGEMRQAETEGAVGTGDAETEDERP